MAQTRMIKVMDHKRVDLRPGRQTFVLLDDDEPHDASATLEITDQDWRDLGRPDKITVTIQPGDLLNE